MSGSNDTLSELNACWGMRSGDHRDLNRLVQKYRLYVKGVLTFLTRPACGGSLDRRSPISR